MDQTAATDLSTREGWAASLGPEVVEAMQRLEKAEEEISATSERAAEAVVNADTLLLGIAAVLQGTVPEPYRRTYAVEIWERGGQTRREVDLRGVLELLLREDAGISFKVTIGVPENAYPSGDLDDEDA